MTASTGTPRRTASSTANRTAARAPAEPSTPTTTRGPRAWGPSTRSACSVMTASSAPPAVGPGATTGNLIVVRSAARGQGPPVRPDTPTRPCPRGPVTRSGGAAPRTPAYRPRMTADPASAERLLAGRYALREVLGRGGMGVVWLATDQRLERPVAVKEVTFALHLSDHEREMLRERTMREARTAARLDHPSVTSVYDEIEEDGRP